MEVMRLQAAQAEGKKESSSNNTASDRSGEKEKEKAEKAASGKEYVECMRRLQSNLAYLAAIADRSHKPSSQIPPHPAILSAPPLTPKALSINHTISTSSPNTNLKKEEYEDKKAEDFEEDRDKILKDQYKRLQALFPGVDPKKEPAPQSANAVARAQQHAQAQAQQQQNQGSDQAQNQQKLQQQMGPKMNAAMMQQRLMQEQANKNQQQQAAMAAAQGQVPSR
jgi:hypothetical protein